jgi:hypothetical protein
MFEHAKTLLANGYSPLPLSAEDGLPHIRRWNEFRERQMQEITLWWHWNLRPEQGLAVVGGYRNLVPIDCDTDDPEVLHAVRKTLPRPLVCRRGTKGFIGFWRDPTGEIANAERKNFCTPEHKPLVEVKVLGVAAIPPTLHRKTRLPYRWTTRRTLFDTHVEELGVITNQHLIDLGKVLEPWSPGPPVAPHHVSRDSSIAPVSEKRMHGCAMAAMRKVVARLSSLSEGRQIGLHNAARHLGKFIHHGILIEADTRNQLIEACRENGSDRSHGLRQCHWTISSGIKRARNDELPVLRDRVMRA